MRKNGLIHLVRLQHSVLGDGRVTQPLHNIDHLHHHAVVERRHAKVRCECDRVRQHIGCLEKVFHCKLVHGLVDGAQRHVWALVGGAHQIVLQPLENRLGILVAHKVGIQLAAEGDFACIRIIIEHRIARLSCKRIGNVEIRARVAICRNAEQLRRHRGGTLDCLERRIGVWQAQDRQGTRGHELVQCRVGIEHTAEPRDVLPSLEEEIAGAVKALVVFLVQMQLGLLQTLLEIVAQRDTNVGFEKLDHTWAHRGRQQVERSILDLPDPVDELAQILCRIVEGIELARHHIFGLNDLAGQRRHAVVAVKLRVACVGALRCDLLNLGRTNQLHRLFAVAHALLSKSILLNKRSLPEHRRAPLFLDIPCKVVALVLAREQNRLVETVLEVGQTHPAPLVVHEIKHHHENFRAPLCSHLLPPRSPLLGLNFLVHFVEVEAGDFESLGDGSDLFAECLTDLSCGSKRLFLHQRNLATNVQVTM
eukprot:comp19126_c0_seq1/m.35553 comp19126_c0_seq1/g.35553  ORF comp19126_c0_seq1/g.35553 comp19126_c0_seq1/m.35553 type:complete len:479 (-) comp19126_c0_seq1:13-1449(-)